ncbi:MAG: hypothetical protein ABIH90_02305 [Candidatus Aenigmatarchaeota archaeon]
MGSSKGLSQTLWIVMAAVVVIVIALVMLTIFGGGIAPITTLTEFTNQCKNTAAISCQTTGLMPLNWNAQVNIGGSLKSCASELSEMSCDDFAATG